VIYTIAATQALEYIPLKCLKDNRTCSTITIPSNFTKTYIKGICVSIIRHGICQRINMSVIKELKEDNKSFIKELKEVNKSYIKELKEDTAREINNLKKNQMSLDSFVRISLLTMVVGGFTAVFEVTIWCIIIMVHIE
jgi:hypothetical protein